MNLDPTDAIFALRQLTHYASFACRSIWRRRVLVLTSFLLTFTMIWGATRLAPRTYHIEVTLLTQTSIVIASLANPSRVIPYDVYAPSRAAAEMVLRRDNVISLVRQTDLLNAWDRTRAPILRLYDRWNAKLRGHEPTADEKLDLLVNQIERRMSVTAQPGSDGLVTIALDWPDPHSGYLLVERAQQSFLQARQVAETQAITEALKVLERYGANIRTDLQATLDEIVRTHAQVLRLQDITPRPSRLRAPTLDPAGPLVSEPTDEEVLVDPGTLADPRLGRLKNAAATKRSELARLESEQKRKMDQLQAQVAAARTIYTGNHPTLQSLEQNVSAFRHDSPQIQLLRNELDELETQADEQAALAAERLVRAAIRQHRPAPRRPASTPRDPLAAPTPPVRADTVSVDGKPRPEAVAEFAMTRLRTQLNQLHGVLERTETARIELEIAKAAFKHRYSVISPAAEPGEPTFPNASRVLFSGLIASVIFALAAAVAADISGKRILEAWQLQRQLGLRVLGAARIL